MTVTLPRAEVEVGTPINFMKAINLAMFDALAADERVFIMGEDIADEEDGGVHKATVGLSTAFGTKRVRSTPIAEEGFVAAGIGAAQAGLLPVVEVMLMGFIGLALDPITNIAAKWRYMTAGRANCPLTIRTRTGAGNQMGAQHTDQLEIWLAAVPGLKVVMASNPMDAYGLFTSAVFDDPDPVVVIENLSVANSSVKVPRPQPGLRVPIGKAHVARPGTDVSVIGYGAQVGMALDAAERLAGEGVDVEVIDLRTISPLDLPTMLSSVAKTRRAVITHEAKGRFGPSAEIAASIYEELYTDLCAPIQRVCAPFTPVPSSRALESAYLPDRADIEAGIRRALGLQG